MKALYPNKILLAVGIFLIAIAVSLPLSGCGDKDRKKLVFPATVTDTETVTCDETTDGWVIVDPVGNGYECATIAITPAPVYEGTGALEFYYSIEPDKFPVLLNTAAQMAELKSLEFYLRSMNNANLLVILNDRDGTTFSYQLSVEAQTWTRVYLVPDDFGPGVIDPARLKSGFALFDTAPYIGVTGNNTLWIDAVTIEREPLIKRTGEWIIDGYEETVTESMLVEGDIRITNGGKLNVTSPRFILKGTLRAEDNGSFDVTGSTLIMPQEFRHQYELVAREYGNIVLTDTDIFSPFPLMLFGNSWSYLSLTGVDMTSAGFHVEVFCVLEIENSFRVGELCLHQYNEVSIIDTDVVLVWLFSNPGITADISLPNGAEITDWELVSGFGINLTIQNSSNVMWGLISFPGSDLTLNDSEILVTGLFFGGNTDQTLSGIENGTSYDNFSNITDRVLNFNNCSVSVWNFYAGGEVNLTIDNCFFGEVFSFQSAFVEVLNSTCDGSGGFVATIGDSSMHIIDSTIDCGVTTFDSSELILENSAMTGDIQATANSTVRLRNTVHTGRKFEFDQGIIIVEY